MRREGARETKGTEERPRGGMEKSSMGGGDRATEERAVWTARNRIVRKGPSEWASSILNAFLGFLPPLWHLLFQFATQQSGP